MAVSLYACFLCFRTYLIFSAIRFGYNYYFNALSNILVSTNADWVFNIF